MTKNALKITVIGFGIIGFLVVGVFFYLVTKLPSPSELRTLLTQPAPKVRAEKEVQSPVAESPTDEPYIPAAQGAAVTPPETMEKIKTLLNEDPKDIRVCDNLRNAQTKKKEEIKIENIFGDENREDPFYEALRIPMKAIFQDPSVVELISEVENMDRGPETFLSKASFYGKAAKTAATLYQQKSYFEQLGDRAEHLMVISRLVALKPELASDSRIYDYCLAVENSLKFNEESSIKEERAALLDLLKTFGVEASALDFKPESFNKFAVKLSKNQFQFDLKSE